ncbi:hypothetical protein V5029_13600, partial [Enterobacter hormaechei]
QNQPRRDDFGLKIGKLSHRTSIKDGLGRHIGSCGPLNRNFLNNPTPYVINFNEITLGNKKLDDVTYVMPSGTARFPLPNGTSGNTLTFKVINDYGSPGELHRASL